MFTDTIKLDYAIEQEALGNLIIFDAGNDSNNDYHPKAKQWKENFTSLRTKFRNTAASKIPQIVQAKYLIEIKTVNKNGTIEWRFLRAVPTNDLNHSIQSSTEYIYILTNPAHPDLVKIGMTRKTPEKRLKQINGTGVINRWRLHFYLPVRAESSYHIEQSVHKVFSNQRYHIERENDTEMFYITVKQAIGKILEVGALHKVGDPKYFEYSDYDYSKGS